MMLADPEELLDLVDENDQVIGTVQRSEANQNTSLIHREVSVLIVDEQGQVLLQQRSMKKKIGAGHWTETAAGHILSGGDPLETAQQELEEELGFSVPLTYYGKTLNRLSNETHFSYEYVGTYTGQEFILNPEEVSQVAFISQEEYPEFLAKNEVGTQAKNLLSRWWNSDNVRS